MEETDGDTWSQVDREEAVAGIEGRDDQGFGLGGGEGWDGEKQMWIGMCFGEKFAGLLIH